MLRVLVCYKFIVATNEMGGMGIFCRYGQNPKLWTICCLTSCIYKDMLISFCTTLFRLLTCHTGKVLRVMWSHQQLCHGLLPFRDITLEKFHIFLSTLYFMKELWTKIGVYSLYVMRYMVHGVFVKWLQHHSFWVRSSIVTTSFPCCVPTTWTQSAVYE